MPGGALPRSHASATAAGAGPGRVWTAAPSHKPTLRLQRTHPASLPADPPHTHTKQNPAPGAVPGRGLPGRRSRRVPTGPAGLTQAPEVRLRLCSRLASRFSRKQRREWSHTGPARVRLSPRLHRWGWGAVQGIPQAASAILSRRPQISFPTSVPLAQHPVGGGGTHVVLSKYNPDTLLFPLLKKKSKKKRGWGREEPVFSLQVYRWLSWLEHRPPHRKVAGSIPGGVCMGGNQCFSLPSSQNKQIKNQRRISSGGRNRVQVIGLNNKIKIAFKKRACP